MTKDGVVYQYVDSQNGSVKVRRNPAGNGAYYSIEVNGLMLGECSSRTIAGFFETLGENAEDFWP